MDYFRIFLVISIDENRCFGDLNFDPFSYVWVLWCEMWILISIGWPSKPRKLGKIQRQEPQEPWKNTSGNESSKTFVCWVPVVNFSQLARLESWLFFNAVHAPKFSRKCWLTFSFVLQKIRIRSNYAHQKEGWSKCSISPLWNTSSLNWKR